MRPLSIELYEMKSLRLCAVRTESQMLALQMSISQWQILSTLISQMSCIKMKILTNKEASSVKHLAFSSDIICQYYGALSALRCDQSLFFASVADEVILVPVHNSIHFLTQLLITLFTSYS